MKTRHANVYWWFLLPSCAALRFVVSGENPPGEQQPAVDQTNTSSQESVNLRLDRYPTLKECYNALPETGGTILLPTHTTTILTDSIVFTKPNVILRGEGWDTVIQRDERAGLCLLELGGVHSTVADLTIDGNGEQCPEAKVELRMKGDSATVRHIQVRNARKMGIGLRSNGGLVTDCLITGLGPKALSSYAIQRPSATAASIRYLSQPGHPPTWTRGFPAFRSSSLKNIVSLRRVESATSPGFGFQMHNAGSCL